MTQNDHGIVCKCGRTSQPYHQGRGNSGAAWVGTLRYCSQLVRPRRMKTGHDVTAVCLCGHCADRSCRADWASVAPTPTPRGRAFLERAPASPPVSPLPRGLSRDSTTTLPTDQQFLMTSYCAGHPDPLAARPTRPAPIASMMIPKAASACPCRNGSSGSLRPTPATLTHHPARSTIPQSQPQQCV
jgi:hypothetical protein